MSCLHIKLRHQTTFKLNKSATVTYGIGKALAVKKRTYTADGVVYHVCDDTGKTLGTVLEKHCEVIDV